MNNIWKRIYYYSLIGILLFAISNTTKAQHLPNIVYSKCKGKLNIGCNIDIVKLNIDTGRENIFIKGSVSRRGEYGVSISDDSRKIAFNTYRYSGWHIATGDIVEDEVQNIEQLTSGRDYQYNLSWAPDNKSFVYQNHGWSDNDTDLIFGSNEKIVDFKIAPKIGGDRTPSYHPDGDRLIFTSGRYGTYDIVEYDFKSKKLEKVLNNQLSNQRHEFAPSYSPDGSKVAFLSEDNGKLDLFMYELGKEDAKNLTKGNYSDDFFFKGWSKSQVWIYKTDWSKDGKYIVFNLVRDGNSELFVANLESEEIIQITNNSSDDFNAKWFD